MTWRTQAGNRVLNGAEFALFKAAVLSLAGDVEIELDDSDCCRKTGIAVFDDLLAPVKLLMLAEVGEGLLQDSRETPTLTALNEGTISAVFAHLGALLVSEIEDDAAARLNESRYCWREKILAAGKQVEDAEYAQSPKLVRPIPGDEDYEAPLLATSLDRDRFDEIMDSLEDAVLWDYDYFDAVNLYDADPGKVPEYFQGLTAIDPADVDLEAVQLRLRRLGLGEIG